MRMDPSELKDYPYFSIMFENFPEYDNYNNNLDSNSVEYVITCPFCGKAKKFYANLTTGSAKCFSASCPQYGRINNIRQFFSVYLSISRVEANKLVDSKLSSQNVVSIGNNILQSYSKESVQKISKDMESSIINVFPDGATRVRVGNKYYSAWLKEIRKPNWNAEWFLNRFPIYEVPAGNYATRAIFEITTKKNRAFLAYKTNPRHTIKTLNPEGNVLSRMLFNYNDLDKSQDTLFVCEGIFSASRVIRAGYNAVCTFGVNMSETQAVLINQTEFPRIIFLYDYGALDAAIKNSSRIVGKLDCRGKQYFATQVPFYDEIEGKDGSTERKGLDPDDLGTKGAKELIEGLLSGAHPLYKAKTGLVLGSASKPIGSAAISKALKEW